MKKLLVFTIILLCFTNAFGQIKDAAKEPSAMTRDQKKEGSNTAPSSEITDEEYAIYIAIFGKSNSGFVIRDKSGFYDFYKNSDMFLMENFDRLKPGTIKDFRSKNGESLQLEKKLPTKKAMRW